MYIYLRNPTNLLHFETFFYLIFHYMFIFSDTGLSQMVHGFQAAEAVRRKYPENEWLQLVGLIHDLGKVLCLLNKDEPQWAVVGDTFPVGCEFHLNSIALGDVGFSENPDTFDKKLNSKLGIYSEHCGIENLHLSWGHDEYLYQVLTDPTNDSCQLPQPALWIIRYHSFYPWHSRNGYEYFCGPRDEEILKWVRLFNEFDLYSKALEIPNISKLRPYYERIAEKYLGRGPLSW